MSRIILYLTIDEFSLRADHREWIVHAVKRALHQERLIIAVTWSKPDINYHWESLQTFLGSIFVTQLTTAYEHNKPLFDCDIILEPECGYDLALEPTWSTVLCAKQDIPQLEAWNNRRIAASLSAYEIEALSAIENDAQPETPIINNHWKSFNHVAIGGTFDHIHAGHKILLTMAALLATTRLVVGVTDDEMLKNKKYREYIASLDDRIKNVQQYLHTIRRGIIHEVVPMSDAFGPTITDPSIEALVCSHETLKGGDAVNRERALLGFPTLELRVIDVISPDNASVKNKDMMLKISSTWIRQYLAEQNQ
ncbi:hypothetical protein DFQ28_000091 [Apophysomyces sp. BC1034]|nr:hypothetical protein DFQ30_006680 [Apophysomyces sp. BC1015]KAG0183220.1 hypothetical protein DFQ29_008580 [Apophysomyces sp. BC1021]KAG0194393.1 hypothetical protein DFQ28_000091 [Apophysomyces sp. BC1034]